MKKVIVISCIILFLLYIGEFFFEPTQNSVEYTKELIGTIVEYELIEEGLKIYIQVVEDREADVVILTEESRFFSEELKEAIQNREAGMEVWTHCIFSSKIDGACPVVAIDMFTETEEKQPYEHEIKGIITAYKDTDSGLLAIIETEGRVEIAIIFTEETTYETLKIENAIKDRTVGIEVFILSEYYTIENETYPVTYIRFFD